ncbi:MAG: hypothetical protein IJ565_01510 [Bacilli bacterium]|nr:hypothetical protein [Bacilli bacterium]
MVKVNLNPMLVNKISVSKPNLELIKTTQEHIVQTSKPRLSSVVYQGEEGRVVAKNPYLPNYDIENITIQNKTR